MIKESLDPSLSTALVLTPLTMTQCFSKFCLNNNIIFCISANFCSSTGVQGPLLDLPWKARSAHCRVADVLGTWQPHYQEMMQSGWVLCSTQRLFPRAGSLFLSDVQHCRAIKQRGSGGTIIMSQIFGSTCLVSSFYGI